MLPGFQNLGSGRDEVEAPRATPGPLVRTSARVCCGPARVSHGGRGAVFRRPPGSYAPGEELLSRHVKGFDFDNEKAKEHWWPDLQRRTPQTALRMASRFLEYCLAKRK